MLGAEQAGLAALFARRGADRFTGPGSGAPLLTSVPAWLVAAVRVRQRLGDHWLVVGEVGDGDARAGQPALVHHDGGWAEAVRLTPRLP
ncbi:flavin reductase family protein [Streptomyces pyxinae]|uniref:flavin reductase family protein n=1 Tax=Streptomyces pyxinae TaxID=2970734 RepID=UPI003D184847